MRRSARVWIASALLASAPVSAFAADAVHAPAAVPAKKPTMADMFEAQKQSRAAAKLAKQGDWAGALALYRSSYALDPRPSTAMSIGRALVKLDRPSEAFDQLSDVLATSEKRLSVAERAEAKAAVEAIGRSTGLLQVSATEAGAEVKIDGAVVGTTPLAKPLRRKLGRHEIAVSKAGFEPFVTTVDLPGGETRTVDAKLGVEVTTAHLDVRERTGADVRVLLDGADRGPAPWQGDVPPGPHSVVLESARMRSREQRFEMLAKHRYALVLAASTRTGRLTVETLPSTATIAIDGKPVGSGAFDGPLPVGAHHVEASAPGYAPRAADVTVDADARAKVDLRLDALVVAVAEDPNARYKGVYVGLEAFGAASLTPVEYPCSNDPSCSSSTQLPFPIGLGGDLRIGYQFGVVGLEVAGAAMYSFQSTTDSYPGSASGIFTGQAVDASVQRDEELSLKTLGGFGGAGVRVTTHGKGARFTLGLDAGLAYRQHTFRRTTTGTFDDTLDASVSYYAPAAMADLGLLIGPTPGAKFKIGVVALADLPGSGRQTDDGNPYSVSIDGRDVAYDASPMPVAKSPELFVGPVLGLEFGR